MRLYLNTLLWVAITLLLQYEFAYSKAQPITHLPAAIIPGMVGEQPKLLSWLMQQFTAKKQASFFVNRLLLYGPPGNGKSTLAQKFAQATDSIFIARSACSMVERYVGQGAANVIELFKQARELYAQHNKKIVIFIDEIDAIATSTETEFRAEHKAALQQLWIELDQCKENTNIFVIFATNEFQKLNKTFLDRLGRNIVEITNPDQELRKQVLHYFCVKAHLSLEPSLVDSLARKSAELSVRALEDIVYGIKMAADLEYEGKASAELVWETFDAVYKKFKENKTNAEEKEKQLQKANTIVSIVSGTLSSVLNSYYLAAIILGIPLQKYLINR